MNSCLKWHGGKHHLAKRIVALMNTQQHTHYVEPFAGALSVMLAKNPEGVSEVANDLHGQLTNFWNVLRDPVQFESMIRILEATPFSEHEWGYAADYIASTLLALGDPVQHAVRFFIYCRQSLAGRMTCFSPLSKNRTRRQMNEHVASWLSAINGLPEVHARLKRVAILGRPAIDCIKSEDTPNTLFYCDPPYLPTTRTSPKVYQHEMSEPDHVALLHLLCLCKAKVMISGYPSPLYDSILAGWKRHDFDIANNAAHGDKKARQTEALWCNFQ